MSEDKLKETSSKNLAKAKQAKLDKLKEKKKKPEYYIKMKVKQVNQNQMMKML